MFGILLILLVAGYLAFRFPLERRAEATEPTNPKVETQLKKLWSIAQTSMREKRPVRAEKALLTILKFDEKNAAAYNRLGILYAKGHKFDEAIECFEIAQSLDNNASSLHNVGLIYLETGAFEKAAMAFKQAIELEDDLPARYIALAKAEEKLGNRKAAVEALEQAYKLDRSINTLRQILAIYEATNDTAAIAEVTARIEQHIAAEAKAKEAAVKSRRRSAMPHIGRASTRATAAQAKARATQTRSATRADQAKLQARAAQARARMRTIQAQARAAKAAQRPAGASHGGTVAAAHRTATPRRRVQRKIQ